MNIVTQTQVGTLESSDVLITIEPNLDNGITVELDSVVKAQFGESIRKTVLQILSEMGVVNARVYLNDRGALDCVIRARMRCAICRAAKCGFDWSRGDGSDGK